VRLRRCVGRTLHFALFEATLLGAIRKAEGADHDLREFLPPRFQNSLASDQTTPGQEIRPIRGKESWEIIGTMPDIKSAQTELIALKLLTAICPSQ